MTRPSSLLAAALLLAFLPATTPARAAVVRPAPGFSFTGEKGRAANVKGVHGRPIILIIAASPDSRPFRRQAREIARRLRFFTYRKTILVAAFTDGARPVACDVPFLIADDARRVAEAYEMHSDRFGVFIIGPDSNLDLRTAEVSRSQKLLDVIDNSYTVQLAARKS